MSFTTQASRSRRLGLSALSLAIASTAISVQAQEENQRRSASQLLLEEVVVTARKRQEGSQDVPLSITAYGSEQLEALKVRDVTNLAVGMPNVALDDVGTSKGTANFSIRGLGINSSIPSIDPTVGLFIDGIYMGVNNGVILDLFDLESVEVLRGPQGTLFGRNVTGGAVLLNTRKPGDELEIKVRTAVEGGGEALNTYAMASISGPLTDTFGAKLVTYYNNDDGWFKNDFTGKEHGENRVKMARGALTWEPTEDFEATFRYEYQESDSDGAASQNHINGRGVANANSSPRDSHRINIDEEGRQQFRTEFAVLDANKGVAFGDGTVTFIYGWRETGQGGLGDIDGLPQPLFHAPSELVAEQNSTELRYNGIFKENTNVTGGFYQFHNELKYQETRLLALGLASFYGGGEYEVDTLGVFATVDYDLTEQLTLTAGARYTKEEKAAKVAYLISNPTACDVVAGTCDFDFVDDENWYSLSPKLGVTYQFSDEMLGYAHWSRGQRSGGYNLRNTSPNPADVPGPFDEERVDNYELGFKWELGGRGRLNGAVFYNEISDMQRELNLPGPAGVIQLVRNTADANILGIELDGTFALTENLLVLASIGYIESEYDKVLFDISAAGVAGEDDGLINSVDLNLDLPRAAPLTYSIGLSHDLTLGDWGYMTSRINFAFRDESAYTDNNLGFIDEQSILDAGIDFYSNDGHWAFGLYGRNLLDEVKHGGDTQLPDTFSGVIPFGGAFAPLAKGQVYGAEVTYTF